MLRILTDRSTGYCGRIDKHDFQLFLAINDIPSCLMFIPALM